jgi:hypothetical protein
MLQKRARVLLLREKFSICEMGTAAKRQAADSFREEPNDSAGHCLPLAARHRTEVVRAARHQRPQQAKFHRHHHSPGTTVSFLDHAH